MLYFIRCKEGGFEMVHHFSQWIYDFETDTKIQELVIVESLTKHEVMVQKLVESAGLAITVVVTETS